MNKYEEARRQRQASDPEYNARRRAQTNKSRPGRKDTRGHRYGRHDKYVVAPIDGEGFEFDAPPRIQPDGSTVDTESRYCLLQILGKEPLWDEKGLRTAAVFHYLMETPSSWMMAGFGLGYDFENWLRDIPDDLYLQSVNDGEPFEWEGYTVRYIPRKMLILSCTAAHLWGSDADKPDAEIERRVYDAQGYFQTSLVSALEKNGLAVDETIIAGKAARGGFRWPDREAVRAYNHAELVAMRRLFTKTRDDVNAGLRAAGLPFELTRRDFYGPGALARKLLKACKWTAQHPLLDLSEEVRDAIEQHPRAYAWKAPFVRQFPFSAAYEGGRIEEAAWGRWAVMLDSDLHSAYPTAMTRLPIWEATDGRYLATSPEASAALRNRMVGMYLLEWNLPEGWDWYPLPYRSTTHNVFFPRTGCGWVMSTEATSALDTVGWDGRTFGPAPEETAKGDDLAALLLSGRPGLRVHAALVLRGTEGLGDGICEPPEGRRSIAAQMIRSAYASRQRLVEQGNPAEKGVKLALNSAYGALWRQVGLRAESPGLFGDLAGAWITSWTRAMIWRRLWGHHADHTVVAIQTDGIAHTGPLDGFGADGPGLGEWETETLRDFRQFLPGIYDFQDPKNPEKRKKKTRGFTNKFDPDAAWQVVTGKVRAYSYTYRFFVGRRHALAQPKRWGEWRYQWCNGLKVFTVSLRSKRFQRETLLEALDRMEREEKTLAAQILRDAKGSLRQWLSDVRRVSEGGMIRPDGSEEVRELPAAFKRKGSAWSLDLVADALGKTENEVLRGITDAHRLAQMSEWQALREARGMLAQQPLPDPADGAPTWTDPKPNPPWTVLAQASHPFRLKFGATPFVPDPEAPQQPGLGDLAERMQMEDAAGEEGLFVAGIGE